MAKMTEGIVETRVHGRYLAIPSATPAPAPVIVGFHGYAEDAEAQLDRLRAIPETSRWLAVSIQALHPFYDRRTNRVVASWMTSQNRETAIADNIAYVAACLDAVAATWPTMPKVVFAGFSQGVAMAFRAAASSVRDTAGVIAVGGDVPPELEPAALRRISSALIARGTTDALYTKKQFDADESRLLQAGVPVRVLELNSGHEWPAGVNDAASAFLREFNPLPQQL